MRSLPGQAAGNCRSWRFCWRPWSLFVSSLLSLSRNRQDAKRGGGIRILKMRLYAQGQTLDAGAQKNKSHDQKKRWTEGLDKKYAGACKKGARGRGRIQGLIAGQLPDFSLGTKPTSSHSSSPPSLPLSHLHRPREETSCWSSQLCWRVAAKGKDEKWRPRDWHESREQEQRAEHPSSYLGQVRVKTLGSWEPLNPSMGTPHHPLLSPRPSPIPPDRCQPRQSYLLLLCIWRQLAQEPRRRTSLPPWPCSVQDRRPTEPLSTKHK